MMRADTKGERTRAALVDAAIRVVAAEGLAALSYRKVASTAAVSLALVNYHFPAKSELVASLSARVLRHYTCSIERAIKRVDSGIPMTFDDIVHRLLHNAITKDLEHSLAWAEIVLEAARHPERMILAREWDSELQRLWTAVARATGYDPSPVSVRSETDLLTGLLFMCLALRVEETSLPDILEGELRGFPDDAPANPTSSHAGQKPSQQAVGTKTRIVESVIDILKAHGPSAISFRAIAERAGLSLAAPSYYFAGIADLLSHSQVTLTERSRDRYREVMKIADRRNLSRTRLIDLTTTIFVREATQSAPDNLAFFANWLEAARRPELRPVIRSFIENQIQAWWHVLPGYDLARRSKRPGLLATILFLGKLVRIISTGSTTADLASAREEFQHAFLRTITGDAGSCFGRTANNEPTS